VNRAIVLIGCLCAAGAVAAYTHSTQDADEPPTFTVHVPERAADPGRSAAPAAPMQRAAVPPGDRVALTRALQRELRRVGCYGGDINGVWTTSSRMAMKSFVDHVNAALPIDSPDHILLSLVQGHQGTACGSLCPPEQAADGTGRCIAGAQSAKAAGDGTAPPSDTGTPAEGDRKAAATATAATAAAGAAVAASATAAKGAPKADVADGGRAGPAATQGDDALKGDRSNRTARHSGPVPPERIHKRRTSRTSKQAQPPKFVRNIMRAFGIR
jgi:hypothetical protein